MKINVRGMTNKELDRQVSTVRYTMSDTAVEFARRASVKQRNLRRYQKRFKQEPYGVQH